MNCLNAPLQQHDRPAKSLIHVNKDFHESLSPNQGDLVTLGKPCGVKETTKGTSNGSLMKYATEQAEELFTGHKKKQG
jgi:hypothetical protein